MTTLYFHIGSGRCGSTLIQAFFNEPGVRQSFAGAGFHFDYDIFNATGDLLPITKYDESVLEPIRTNLIGRHKGAAYGKLFTTQEAFIGTVEDHNEPNSTDLMSQCLEYLCQDFETKILLVLRRQDTYIESLYNQVIKRGEIRQFQTYLDEFQLDRLEWDRIADVYAARFGAENVLAVPFERPVFASAGYDNFIEGLLEAMGVPAKVGLEKVPTVNPSLAARTVELQLLANKMLTKDEAHALANWFEQNIPKRPDEKYELIKPEQRMKLISHFKESNQRLFETYMPLFDPTHFTAPPA